jgi:hypothetical protein
MHDASLKEPSVVFFRSACNYMHHNGLWVASGGAVEFCRSMDRPSWAFSHSGIGEITQSKVGAKGRRPGRFPELKWKDCISRKGIFHRAKTFPGRARLTPGCDPEHRERCPAVG